MLAALEDPGCLASPPEGSRQVWREPTGSELGEEEKGRSTGGAGDTSRNPNAGWLCVEGDSPKLRKHLCPRPHPRAAGGLRFADFTGALVSRAADPS